MAEWWRGAVIYQVYPRSFQDSNNDGIGDLPGLLKRLPYIADLGVEGIWISPFVKSPQKDFGYDVSDYCDVDPQFGTMADFDAIIKEAHRLGLKIITDQVWAHTSEEHPWFKESRASKTNPKRDWYVWADPKADGTVPNNWLSCFGGAAWQWDTRTHQYYYHLFLKEQPNLNLRNEGVVQAIEGVAKFWLDRGVDGFRLDVVDSYMIASELTDNPARPADAPRSSDIPWSNPLARQMSIFNRGIDINAALIKRLRKYVDQWPDRVLLGETGGENNELKAANYTRNGMLHMAYCFAMLTTGFGREVVRDIISRIEKELGTEGWFCWATGNHDVPRVVSRWRGLAYDANPAFARLTMALGLSLRGSFCIYQGEELGLPEVDVPHELMVDPFGLEFYPEFKGRDGCRTPMAWEAEAAHLGFSGGLSTWLPVGSSHKALAADQQERDPNSLLNTYRRFLKWRRATPAMRVGDITLFDTSPSVLGWRREKDGQRIDCIFNLKETPAELPLPKGRLADVSRAEVKGGTLHLPGWGYAFLEE